MGGRGVCGAGQDQAPRKRRTKMKHRVGSRTRRQAEKIKAPSRRTAAQADAAQSPVSIAVDPAPVAQQRFPAPFLGGMKSVQDSALPFFEKRLTAAATAAHGHLSIPKVWRANLCMWIFVESQVPFEGFCADPVAAAASRFTRAECMRESTATSVCAMQAVAEREFIAHLPVANHAAARWLQVLDVNGARHSLYITHRIGVTSTLYSITGYRPLLLQHDLVPGDDIIFSRKADGTFIVSGRHTRIAGMHNDTQGAAEKSKQAASVETQPCGQVAHATPQCMTGRQGAGAGGSSPRSASPVHDGGGNESDTGTCICLLYTSPSPRDRQKSRMPSSA